MGPTRSSAGTEEGVVRRWGKYSWRGAEYLAAHQRDPAVLSAPPDTAFPMARSWRCRRLARGHMPGSPEGLQSSPEKETFGQRTWWEAGGQRRPCPIGDKAPNSTGTLWQCFKRQESWKLCKSPGVGVTLTPQRPR